MKDNFYKSKIYNIIFSSRERFRSRFRDGRAGRLCCCCRRRLPHLASPTAPDNPVTASAPSFSLLAPSPPLQVPTLSAGEKFLRPPDNRFLAVSSEINTLGAEGRFNP